MFIDNIMDNRKDLLESLTEGMSPSDQRDLRVKELKGIAEKAYLTNPNVFVKFIQLAEGKKPLTKGELYEWADAFVEGREYKLANDFQKGILSKLDKAKYEGIVPDTYKDDEKTLVKKLTEADDEPKDATEEESEEKVADVVDDNKEDTTLDIDKEYFGQKDGDYFYIVSADAEGGKDLQIVSADGEPVFSAKDNEVDSTDMVAFIKAASRDLGVTELSYDLFTSYILPLLEEPDVKDETPEPAEDEAPTEPDMADEPDDSEELPESFDIRLRGDTYTITPGTISENRLTYTINNKPFSLSTKLAERYGDITDATNIKSITEKIARDTLRYSKDAMAKVK